MTIKTVLNVLLFSTLAAAAGACVIGEDEGTGDDAQAVAQAANSGKAGKVDICHRTFGKNPYIMINVSQNAVDAHLAHGDMLANDGECGDPDDCSDDSEDGCSDDDGPGDDFPGDDSAKAGGV